MKALLICCLLSIFCFSATAQERKPAKIRTVRVTLTDDSTVTGSLIKIDGDKLHIKDATRETIIDFDNISLVEFGNGTQSRIPASAVALLKRIRALAVSAPTLTRFEYMQRFGDIVADAKDALAPWQDWDAVERTVSTLSLHKICADAFTDGTLTDERVLQTVRRNLDSIIRTVDDLMKK